VRVLVLPGNPGVAQYYGDFCTSLQAELGGGALVHALGLLGHTTAAPKEAPLRTYLLDEQEQHVLAALDAQPGPVLLVGHSIGAYLALRALQARPACVLGVVGLYPFLRLNEDSWEQRAIKLACRLQPLVLVVALCAALLAALPLRLRRFLLQPLLRLIQLDDAALETTLSWVRAGSALNVCHLGASEFTALARPQDLASMHHLDRVALLYGPAADFWAPPAHAAEVRRLAPHIRVETDSHGGHGHMYCTTAAGSRTLAAATARLLRSFVP
jgi:pimeloyl-ACP methyl ester carboxylesterase